MKYYEFGNKFPYYALICANSEYEAIGYYVTNVCKIIENTVGEMPNEITEAEVRAMVKLELCNSDDAKEFENIISGTKVDILLIDSSLI